MTDLEAWLKWEEIEVRTREVLGWEKTLSIERLKKK